MQKRAKKAYFFICAACCVLLLILAAHYGSTALARALYPEHPRAEEGFVKALYAEQVLRTLQESDGAVILGFVGDIMLDRGVAQKIAAHGNDYAFPFRNVADILRAFDILAGNLEGPVSARGADQGSVYSFRMSPAVAPALKASGFDVLSLANNHIGDWGPVALQDTPQHLNAAGITPLGYGYSDTEAFAPHFFTAEGGVRIAFIGASQFGEEYLTPEGGAPGVAVLGEPALADAVQRARKNADVVVVTLHFGEEYAPEQNAYQERVSKTAIDAGADLVVGHHPHVIQPLEQYKDGWIAYSLGNFVFDQYFSKETMEGGLLVVEVRGKRVTDVSLERVVLNESFQPALAPSFSGVLDSLLK